MVTATYALSVPPTPTHCVHLFPRQAPPGSLTSRLGTCSLCTSSYGTNSGGAGAVEAEPVTNTLFDILALRKDCVAPSLTKELKTRQERYPEWTGQDQPGW
jgi:hypothetical protein